MSGNFSYKNATKLYFGDESLKFLNEELPKYGKCTAYLWWRICKEEWYL
ncbi:hypothetical protein SAMN05216356_11568 [Oribacterium sp. WCC10]|nr:hypothetical protein [Oribacterium sp. WCC10]SFG62708.1 hypothetical protein SAMN05216356_11568 [Oribacterium sp. WCC10]